jgi:lysophospholipase L1-like esterase
MKNKSVIIALSISLLIIAALSCKKNSPSAPGNSPQSTATVTYTPTQTGVDNSLYGFEDGTVMGWTYFLDGLIGSSNSTDRAYYGTHSLAVSCSLTSSTGQNSIGTRPPLAPDLTGKTMKIKVYVPSGFPANGGGILYIKSGSAWAWAQGPWKNYTPGQWNELTLNPAAPDQTQGGAVTITQIQEIGIKIAPPSGSSWWGTCYIDALELVNAPSPTITPTRTPSTPTPTRTPGGPTDTPTNTPIPDNTLYGYEDGTVMGWTKSSAQIASVSNNSDQNNAYYGSHSLLISCAFTSSISAQVYVAPPSVTNFTGKMVVAKLWIPADFSSSGGGTVYLTSGTGSTWSQGLWQNFVPGTWNTFYFNPYKPDPSYPVNDITNIKSLGIIIMPPAAYTGSMYLDAVDLVNAPPTETYTNTPVPTVIPGNPTYTPTDTPVPVTNGPTDPNIQYFGRWDMSDPGNYRADWTAAAISITFTGTSVGIKLSDSTFQDNFQYSIDGGAFTQLLANTSTSYSLASGLVDTTHTLYFVKRTDCTFGVANFQGFTAADGGTFTLGAPGAKPPRRIEIIGDSISVGTGNEGTGGNTRFNENGYLAFGPMIARQLNAEYSVIARGGLGAYHNWNEAWPPAEQHAIDYFKQTLYNYAYPLWDFSRWQPDAVIVALGANDTNGQWDMTASSNTKTAYVAAYNQLLDYIRLVYPNTNILCMEPIPVWCMQYDGAGTGGGTQTYIKTIVQARQSTDSKLYYLQVNTSYSSPLLSNSDYIGDSTHPNVGGDTKVANDAVPKIKTLLGW